MLFFTSGSEAFRVDSSQRLLLGTTTARETGSGFTSLFQIEGANTISSASADEDLIKGYRERIASSVEYSLQPLIQYLSLFKGYEHIVNVDNKDHIEHKIEVHHKDEESTELELPYVVSVAQVMGVIEGHQEEMKEIKESLPAKPLTCGLFSVDVKSSKLNNFGII